MRWLVVLSLMLVYALTAWRIWFPIVHYEVQKADYIAQCQNRAKPQLRCEGRCALSRKMALLHQQDAANREPQALPMADITPHVAPVSAVPVTFYVQRAHFSALAFQIEVRAKGVDVPPPRV